MTDVLTTEEVKAKLAALDGWELAGKAITKEFSFKGFGEAMAFMNRMANLAERQHHHPDIDIRYDTVRLTLSTHSAGGLTGKDFRLAEAVEESHA